MLQDLSWPESFLILAVILLIFGAGKLPQIGKALGKGVRDFRQSSRGEIIDGPAGSTPVMVAFAGQPVIPQKEVGKVSGYRRLGWVKKLFRCGKGQST